MTAVKNGDRVRIHYTGKLSDGTEFDSSRGRQPLEFEVGAGQIISGLDNEVNGMAVGDSSTVTVPAAEAYGPRDEALVHELPRSSLPDDIEPEPGLQLEAQAPDGRRIGLTVTDVKADAVTVDANHPLAGEDLTFDIEVVERVEA